MPLSNKIFKACQDPFAEEEEEETVLQVSLGKHTHTNWVEKKEKSRVRNRRSRSQTTVRRSIFFFSFVPLLLPSVFGFLSCWYSRVRSWAALAAAAGLLLRREEKKSREKFSLDLFQFIHQFYSLSSLSTSSSSFPEKEASFLPFCPALFSICSFRRRRRRRRRRYTRTASPSSSSALPLCVYPSGVKNGLARSRPHSTVANLFSYSFDLLLFFFSFLFSRPRSLCVWLKRPVTVLFSLSLSLVFRGTSLSSSPLRERTNGARA